MQVPKNTGKHSSDAERERAEVWYAQQAPWDSEGMRRAREALWAGKPIPFRADRVDGAWVPGPLPVPEPAVEPIKYRPFPVPEARRPMLSKRLVNEAYRINRERSVARPRAKNGDGWVTARKQAKWMDADPCVYCGGPGDSYDHITPRKRGGTNGQENLARVCHSCNHEKTSRTLLMFLAIRAQRKVAGTYRRLPDMKLRYGRKQVGS